MHKNIGLCLGFSAFPRFVLTQEIPNISQNWEEKESVVAWPSLALEGLSKCKNKKEKISQAPAREGMIQKVQQAGG